VAGTRTFVDADVLITAFRGTGQVLTRAQNIIDDPDREFVASDILRLELLPKAPSPLLPRRRCRGFKKVDRESAVAAS